MEQANFDQQQLKLIKIAEAAQWALAAQMIEDNLMLSRAALRQMCLDKYYALMDDATAGEFTKAKTELENKFKS